MLTEQSLRAWIRDLRSGKRRPAELLERLSRLPYENLGFARLDTHRRLRRGLPEVIFCEGKQPDHLIAIAQRLSRHESLVLLTRLSASMAQVLQQAIPGFRYEALSRLGFIRSPQARTRLKGLVAVVSAGTSDLAVAEEAAKTLELIGSRVLRLYDVGVAGLHRLLEHWQALRSARVIVVVAGMEGALASVVGGLVSCPVVAVPTSVGYGASFEGIAPLLTMLNSCAPGVGVVNIDNGFGAAYLAHIINCPAKRSAPTRR